MTRVHWPTCEPSQNSPWTTKQTFIIVHRNISSSNSITIQGITSKVLSLCLSSDPPLPLNQKPPLTPVTKDSFFRKHWTFYLVPNLVVSDELNHRIITSEIHLSFTMAKQQPLLISWSWDMLSVSSLEGHIFIFVACEGPIHTLCSNETLPWEVVDGFLQLFQNIKDTWYNYDAKIAKSCNLWIFWPKIQLINHLFKIWQNTSLDVEF